MHPALGAGPTRDGIDALVGARLVAIRQRLGVGQTQLARAVGVSVAEVHNWEHGLSRIDARHLIEIVRALGVPIGELWAGI